MLLPEKNEASYLDWNLTGSKDGYESQTLKMLQLGNLYTDKIQNFKVPWVSQRILFNLKKTNINHSLIIIQEKYKDFGAWSF